MCTGNVSELSFYTLRWKIMVLYLTIVLSTLDQRSKSMSPANLYWIMLFARGRLTTTPRGQWSSKCGHQILVDVNVLKFVPKGV